MIYPSVWEPESLAADIGQNRDAGAVTEQVNQSRLPSVGDISTTARPHRSAEQHPPLSASEHQGFHGIPLALSPGEPVPIDPPCSRSADSNRGGIQDRVLPAGAEMVDNLGQRGQPLSLADPAAALDQKGPGLADGPSDRGTIDLEPCRQHIVRRDLTQVHQRRPQPIHKHESVLGTRPERAATPARTIEPPAAPAIPGQARPPDYQSPRPTTRSPDAETTSPHDPHQNHLTRSTTTHEVVNLQQRYALWCIIGLIRV